MDVTDDVPVLAEPSLDAEADTEADPEEASPDPAKEREEEPAAHPEPAGAIARPKTKRSYNTNAAIPRNKVLAEAERHLQTFAKAMEKAAERAEQPIGVSYLGFVLADTVSRTRQGGVLKQARVRQLGSQHIVEDSDTDEDRERDRVPRGFAQTPATATLYRQFMAHLTWLHSTKGDHDLGLLAQQIAAMQQDGADQAGAEATADHAGVTAAADDEDAANHAAGAATTLPAPLLRIKPVLRDMDPNWSFDDGHNVTRELLLIHVSHIWGMELGKFSFIRKS